METELQQQSQPLRQEQIFEKFEAYDFENDETFQTGLKSIVSKNTSKSEQEQQDAIQNAKFFYFSRFVQPFDYSQYRSWRSQNSVTSGSLGSTDKPEVQSTVIAKEEESLPSISDATSSTPAADPSYPKSFQEICELIAAGKPIPGIRQIPNNLAEGTPSEAKLTPKLKPWEQKKATAAAAAAAATSTPATAVSTESTAP
ncbi:hypothetical protein BGZ49_001722 [Haplosporangium sp. Z 27]|nr:hypothetical protein BGZ49_001722 [Haplosporangium sp. Z 27]